MAPPVDRVLVAATRPLRPLRTPVADLLADGMTLTGDRATVVTGVSLSSQRILPGDLYAALPGARVHGIDFATDALDAGATAILTDEVGANRIVPGSPLLHGAPVLVAPDPRAVLGRLAAQLYGHPASAMRMIGVTGTQGKTTATRLLEGGLQKAGITAGVIGTVGTRVAGKDLRTSLTTPEAPDLHGLFAVMREKKVGVCAMEVSSHALVLGRVDGVVFDVAVFLNLGRDHLDFHRDVAEYYAAKASLFTPERARLGLVSIDDEHGRRLAAEAPIEVRTFSVREQSGADWTAVDVELGPAGSTFRVVGPEVDVAVHCPLPGDFNVANTLAAVAAAAEAGLPATQVRRLGDAIGRAGGVPGRLERVEAGQDFTVVVDYAHKPDAVEAVLRTLRPLTPGRVIVVLGAGGDRDTGKRPIMGGIAARLADVVVITDDNPRSEDPAAIRAEIRAGTRGGTAEVVEVGDRRTAIEHAVALAAPGDIVLLAGKGHESGQEVAGVVHPFDDREVAREVLLTRLRGATGMA